MSSRALRKAQKEREKSLLAQQTEQDSVVESDDEDLPQSTSKPSIFAMLDQSGLDDEGEDGAEGSTAIASDKGIHSTDEDDQPDSIPVSAVSTPKSSTKRKKKKKKTKAMLNSAPSSTIQPAPHTSDTLDEIDIALRSLSVSGGATAPSKTSRVSRSAAFEICDLLSIDIQHLHVANEMKRLFGRAALEVDREDEAAAAPSRQRLAHGEGFSLAEAVKGKRSNGGAGLPAVLRRRNIFVPGKEEWPRATGGGLTMEIVDPHYADGSAVQYSFVHNSVYQNSQKEFQNCVLSMDPSRMINLLQFNPYHISTLLQVSEIAKHEKDYATSGDLLERALFSFGRALHPTFANNLAQGKARLDFRRAENREFWLTCWRYIANISMRATWRTAYEWARLLLSLDPDSDPYCVSLVIDQLAIRAKQPDSLLSLMLSNQFIMTWSCDANIQFSHCLALLMHDKQPEKAREALTKTVEQFPWVAARLYQELNLDKLPKGIWGKKPLSPVDELHSELYVGQAIDLWKLPDNLALLISAASAATSLPEGFSGLAQHREPNLNEARYVVLTEKPALIGLLPRSITSQIDSMSDPLPPEDAIETYDTRVSGKSSHHTLEEELAARLPAEELIQRRPQQFIEEIFRFQRFFESLIPGLPSRGEDAEISDEVVEQAIARSNLSVSEMRASMARLIALRMALVAQPGQRVMNAETGDEVHMREDGVVVPSWQRRRRERATPEIEDDEALARQLMEEEFHDAQEVQREADGGGDGDDDDM